MSEPYEGAAVVAGGGIGGLAAALALHRRGWRVQVLERAAEFGEVGAGVTLMTNALRALEALGVGEVVRAAGSAEAPGGARTPSGRWLSRIDGAEMTRQLGTTALGIHRATLHALFRDALPPGVLWSGAEVVAVRPGADAAPAEVDFVRDGVRSTVRAALVVAADGLSSRTRHELWPDTPQPAYAGSTAWRAVTREQWRGELAVAVTWGRGTEFGMVPLGDGRVYWYGAANAPAGDRSRDELGEVRRIFGSWHAPIPALLNATDATAVLRHDLYQLAEPLPTFVRGRVALLGDAAHAMTPNLGQGACQALEDAAVLGAVCPPGADVGGALARYDGERRPRAQRVARASHLAGRFGQQLTNPVSVAARNAVMRLTPSRVTLASMTRFADWRPPGS